MYVRSILAYESSVFKAYTLYCIYITAKKDVGRFIFPAKKTLEDLFCYFCIKINSHGRKRD